MPLRAAAALLTLACSIGLAAAEDRPSGTTRTVVRHADWSVIVAETDRGKLCYAAASPQTRRPQGAVRGPAFVFVTARPTDQVRDEFSVEFGFEVTTGAMLSVGGENFPLAGDAVGAWIKDIADETRLVAAMRSNDHMQIRSMSVLAEETIDTYSLAGFAEALARARRECADPHTTS
jgi:invasion protein IalB